MEETKEERFKRLASSRTNTILKKLDVLGNCSNIQVYGYTKKDIDKIFSAIEAKMKQTRGRFSFPDEEKFRL
ncbi:MAG: hypothetical protein QME42_00585 [bacterium]|nr:hypothetical protein [bacterium]